MTAIKDMPTHLRPREKLQEKGVENLTDEELLAILIRIGRAGKSAIDLAGIVKKKFGIMHLSQVTYADLKLIKGMDAGKICSILAAIELGKRSLRNFETTLPILNSPQSAMDQLSELRSYKKEYFVALYLNARSQLVHKEIISIGTLTASLVHPRELFEPAIRYTAASIIIAHNHPSGNLEPSPADLEVTRRMVESGKLMDIPVQDHLIIGKSGFVSLRAAGQME